MLTPTFHFKILDGFIEIMSEKSKILVRKLQKEAESQAFDIYPYITKCTLDIICGNIQQHDFKFIPSYSCLLVVKAGT
jgi:cytochrome P450